MAQKERLIPTGTCWCGCGEQTKIGSFFLSGHDRVAESAVVKMKYGGVPEFLSHHGYGPNGKNAREELAAFLRRGGPQLSGSQANENHGRTHRELSDLSRPSKKTTVPGYVNRNGQRNMRDTGLPGTDHGQRIYELECGRCGQRYGANGSDVFQRKCPKCQGGAPGLGIA